MDKVQNLKDKARAFRTLLQTHDWKDTDAQLLLRWLTPLFEEIEAGLVQPPQHYQYRFALGKDNTFYEPGSPFAEAEAQFVSALEDWESQEWYQKFMEKNNDGKD
ncbi:hypothetical protein B0G75_104158 [Paraburkholderia sp. BL18I3N2]|uniref:hypothetical protein n=1 Tax=Paraburkholderia sp. BL18I3N2 TaxID=1938799 RepID=UPI000D079D45|nr:hypothetical protein [Paraburkholderia sp. BL18I3N2]PRX32139.1 hypothetical protein B0G75_104158 [Paraburkholderia sp. BL18I3N2]